MQDLYVVTHPHAEHTAQDVVGGWHNSVLTPAGRRDAELIAKALKRRRTGTSRPNSWLAQRQAPAPDDNRLDHRGPVAGAETRREIASRIGECVRELMNELDHDHIVVTHGFAHTFAISAWLQLPVEAAGFATFATTPGAITHLRHDGYWRNRTLAQLADTSHLDRGTIA
ncbi:histidine phosphatase family protein [Rhodococcus erythropolis]|uniref:histidine phosphatase family protein n=1 Tax=Rhodococcus erythropolis TaxID=1833 RepID=UPI00294A7BB1|nr:histidine phosphatase family protein [Rhodococcus erythropolis]MDV6276619.1 histidine phosphatase family protein [Rhodococcus erythropolis]